MTYDIHATVAHAISNPDSHLTAPALAAAAALLNYGGSYDDAPTLATFTEARAQHPAYSSPDRAAAIQVFRLRLQELLGVERDL